MFSNLMVTIYLGIRPMKTLFLNRLEFFNEMAVSIVTYHYLFFTSWVYDADLTYLLGWSCIGYTSFYILVN
jgi:hypothetical protein